MCGCIARESWDGGWLAGRGSRAGRVAVIKRYRAGQSKCRYNTRNGRRVLRACNAKCAACKYVLGFHMGRWRKRDRRREREKSALMRVDIVYTGMRSAYDNCTLTSVKHTRHSANICSNPGIEIMLNESPDGTRIRAHVHMYISQYLKVLREISEFFISGSFHIWSDFDNFYKLPNL